MPHPPHVPKLRRHPKGSVVVLDGKYIYCGPYGSPEAQEKYDRLIAEWLAQGRRLPVEKHDEPLTVNELILRYWRFVKGYYVKDGRPTSEQDTIRPALRFVRRLYGSTPAKDFSPRALKAVREAMIEHKITRKIKVCDKETGEVREVVRVERHGLS